MLHSAYDIACSACVISPR